MIRKAYSRELLSVFIASLFFSVDAFSMPEMLGSGPLSGVGLPEVFVEGSLEERAKMPSGSIRTLDGKDLSMHDFGGKVVVISFGAPWNMESVVLFQELDHIKRYLRTHNLEDQVTFLPIFSDSTDVELVKTFCESHGIETEVYLDKGDSLFDLFDARVLPVTLIVDRHGLISHRISRPMRWYSIDVINVLLSMAKEP